MEDRRRYLSEIVLWNAESLYQAVVCCSKLGIGAFRINSQMMPLATHPVSGYTVSDLVEPDAITAAFHRAREEARLRDIRLSFHPDQFVVLNSESERVVASSVAEMNHQATLATVVGAEALTLHAGGLAGGVEAALERLERGIDQLAEHARSLLALENDDRLFSPSDLLPFCNRLGIPFVYDVHHHRCNTDGVTVADTTRRAAETWRGCEPWMHISSPRDGWSAKNPRPHADFIDIDDVPIDWIGRPMTIDVEAKGKERAVLAISDAIGEQWQA